VEVQGPDERGIPKIVPISGLHGCGPGYKLRQGACGIYVKHIHERVAPVWQSLSKVFEL